MSIIGFNFTKMLADKKKPAQGSINIQNNLELKSVEEAKMAVGDTKLAMKLHFRYTTHYTPDIGLIEFEGNLLFLDDKEKVKEALDKWQTWLREKKFGPIITDQIVPHILNKCNIQAIILSKDINLPAPIPLPRPKTK